MVRLPSQGRGRRQAVPAQGVRRGILTSLGPGFLGVIWLGGLDLGVRRGEEAGKEGQIVFDDAEGMALVGSDEMRVEGLTNDEDGWESA